MSSNLKNREEIAEYLGVKPSTIYNWTHTRYIPFIKLGKLLRFNQVKIDEWLELHSSKGRKTKKIDISKLDI